MDTYASYRRIEQGMMKENRLVLRKESLGLHSIFLVEYSLFVPFNFRHFTLYTLGTYQLPITNYLIEVR